MEDAHQLTQYLQKKFNKDKTFVVCHSWGTIIGLRLVSKYPGDYLAYIGIGQFVHPNKSEALAINYVKEQAKINNDSVTLDSLDKIAFSEEQGFKNGFEDLFKFRMLGNKYFTRKEVAVLPDPRQLYPGLQ